MEWRICKRPQWFRGMKSNKLKEFEFIRAEIDEGVFLVFPHYDKKFEIKAYSVWLQTNSHVIDGGDNFALKIRKCDSFSEGCRIARSFYEELKEGNNPKFIGTQYIDSDIYLDGPFI